MTPEQERKLNEVYEFVQSMRAAGTLPYEVEQALRTRFDGGLGLTVSTKGVDTEDVTVNEGGSSSYAVMNDPDGFLQVTINGTLYYIPIFT